MQENTNKSIAINSIILYVRMIITALCAILTTRFALHALGVTDFGLFSLLGGIISFILIFNTIMLSTTNRFIAVALGKGNIQEANEQFNVNFAIHLALALLTLVIAFPLGDWYINNYVNYDGNPSVAAMVFRWSIIGSIISFIGVPFNGLLMAKEKFIVFCLADIISHVLKLVIAYLLIYFFVDKIFIYAAAQSILTASTTIVYAWYCYKHYPELTHFKIVREKDKYIKVFTFSGWVAYGAFATVGKDQGAAVLVNLFFNTAMNTALGVANSINAYIQMFAQNIANPIAPQLTKSYAAGDMKRCSRLLTLSTKLSFLVMLMISTPFLVDSEWLLSIWLGKAPEFASSFLCLLIIDTLITALYMGVANVVFASGKIAWYQFFNNTLRLVSIGFAYFVLKQGVPAHSLFLSYIAFTIIIFFVGQIILGRQLHFDTKNLWRNSYLPSIRTTIVCLPVFLIRLDIHPLLHITLALLYVGIVVLFLGFNKDERAYMKGIMNKLLTKLHS